MIASELGRVPNSEAQDTEGDGIMAAIAFPATEVAPRHHFTVEEFHRMVEAGFFGETARVELIAGDIIDMAPIGPIHASRVDWLNMEFAAPLRGRAIVRIQGP